jgi:sulfite reductase beta subunit-like hemoprotein
LRLAQEHLAAPLRHSRQKSIELLFKSPRRVPADGKALAQQKSGVVPGARILAPRIAEANDKEQVTGQNRMTNGELRMTNEQRTSP